MGRILITRDIQPFVRQTAPIAKRNKYSWIMQSMTPPARSCYFRRCFFLYCWKWLCPRCKWSEVRRQKASEQGKRLNERRCHSWYESEKRYYAQHLITCGGPKAVGRYTHSYRQTRQTDRQISKRTVTSPSFSYIHAGTNCLDERILRSERCSTDPSWRIVESQEKIRRQWAESDTHGGQNPTTTKTL